MFRVAEKINRRFGTRGVDALAIGGRAPQVYVHGAHDEKLRKEIVNLVGIGRVVFVEKDSPFQERTPRCPECDKPWISFHWSRKSPFWECDEGHRFTHKGEVIDPS